MWYNKVPNLLLTYNILLTLLREEETKGLSSLGISPWV